MYINHHTSASKSRGAKTTPPRIACNEASFYFDSEEEISPKTLPRPTRPNYYEPLTPLPPDTPPPTPFSPKPLKSRKILFSSPKRKKRNIALQTLQRRLRAHSKPPHTASSVSAPRKESKNFDKIATPATRALSPTTKLPILYPPTPKPFHRAPWALPPLSPETLFPSPLFPNLGSPVVGSLGKILLPPLRIGMPEVRETLPAIKELFAELELPMWPLPRREDVVGGIFREINWCKK
ncbi:hypothetical protein RUND412_001712 [Rhizina undulata]